MPNSIYTARPALAISAPMIHMNKARPTEPVLARMEDGVAKILSGHQHELRVGISIMRGYSSPCSNDAVDDEEDCRGEANGSFGGGNVIE